MVRFIENLHQSIIQSLPKSRIDEQSDHPSEEVQERYTAAGFLDLDVANHRPNDWYCLLRNVQGAAALPHILDGTLSHQVDSTNFEQDGLFCEWTYYIDWEARELSVRWSGHEQQTTFENLSEQWMLVLDAGQDEG